MRVPRSASDLPLLVTREEVIRYLENQKDDLQACRAECDRLREQLEEVRRVASQALQAYVDGASVHDIRSSLRDVVSGARRR